MILEVKKCFPEYDECRPVKIYKIRREKFLRASENFPIKILIRFRNKKLKKMYKNFLCEL